MNTSSIKARSFFCAADGCCRTQAIKPGALCSDCQHQANLTARVEESLTALAAAKRTFYHAEAVLELCKAEYDLASQGDTPRQEAIDRLSRAHASYKQCTR